MKTRMIEVRVFEKGDRVMSPAGSGTVMETDTFETEYEYLSRWTKVRLDNAPGAKVVPMDSDLLISLDEWEAGNRKLN
jgi:hypothetical protein